MKKSVYDGFDEYLHGSLSSSNAPTPEDDNFNEYCESLRQSFITHSINGKLETKFKLYCMIGSVENLLQ